MSQPPTTPNSPAAQPLALAAFRERCNAGLQDAMEHYAQLAERIDPMYAELLTEVASFMGRGGKRLRPYLLYLGYLGFGGTDEAAIIRLSASQELYHNAWLIHDDIIDRDLMRYGGPNIAGSYRQRFAEASVPDGNHMADAMALLAGDVNLALGLDLILDSPFPAERKLAAARRAQRLIFEVAGGELLDVRIPSLGLAEVTPDRLMRINQYKTASYTFDAPLQIGGCLAGASPERLAAVTDFALPLGIAFQIADDLLGTYGNEAELGKPVLSDLREGKRTLLILSGLRRSSHAQRQRLEAILGNPSAGYRHLAEVREILDASGAHTETQELAQQQVQHALKALPAVGFTPAVEAQLAELAQFVVNRRS